MTFPAIPSPLGGILGATTASFFKLSPLGVPFEPLIDLVPGITPLRMTFDMIDSESETIDFDVTEHAVQSFLDITANIRERLRTLTITGTLGATPPLVLHAPIPVPGSFARLDLLRIENLKNLAAKREPIMVVTPRVSFPSCAIVSVNPTWNPGLGESSQCSVTLREVRLISPILGTLQADFPAQAPGNNAAAGGGQSATSTTTHSGTKGAVDALPPGPGAP
jgi:hypothetical protein